MSAIYLTAMRLGANRSKATPCALVIINRLGRCRKSCRTALTESK